MLFCVKQQNYGTFVSIWGHMTVQEGRAFSMSLAGEAFKPYRTGRMHVKASESEYQDQNVWSLVRDTQKAAEAEISSFFFGHSVRLDVLRSGLGVLRITSYFVLTRPSSAWTHPSSVSHPSSVWSRPSSVQACICLLSVVLFLVLVDLQTAFNTRSEFQFCIT